MKDIKELKVVLNNDTVGYLKQEENQVLFQYDIDFQHHGFSLSPLSLPLDNRIYISKSNNFEGLYGVFYDSLPDGWGNLLIHKQMQKIGINYDALSSLTKLSLIGKNGLGGLEYIPTQFFDNKNIDYNLDTLAKYATNVYMNIDDDLDAIYKYAGSSGGARPKAHLMIDNEEWIVKFPCSFEDNDSGIKEYNANVLAKKCGIDTNEFKLFKSNTCNGYFGTKRFDRRNNNRLHYISLSSLLETSHLVPNLDYLHLFQIINRICVNANDLYEAYRRMCFNVLFGNKDDHGKNFGFIYDDGYKLSPFFDITKTDDKLEHEMTLNGNPNPSKDDLIMIIDKLNLNRSVCIDIVDNIEKIICKQK